MSATAKEMRFSHSCSGVSMSATAKEMRFSHSCSGVSMSATAKEMRFSHSQRRSQTASTILKTRRKKFRKSLNLTHMPAGDLALAIPGAWVTLTS